MSKNNTNSTTTSKPTAPPRPVPDAPDISKITHAETQKLVTDLHNKSLAVAAVAASKPGPHTAPWRIGANYLIRTVTMIDTGRLVDVTPTELVLEDAAWIADSGRFSDAVAKASFNEVEPFPAGRVIIGRGAVIDAVEIASIPRAQK